MARMLGRLFTLPALEQADRELGLRQRIRDVYDELGGYVHTRGYKFSASGLNRTNINRFNERSETSSSVRSSGDVVKTPPAAGYSRSPSLARRMLLST